MGSKLVLLPSPAKVPESLLALLSLYELLRKRIETDVAFTREYTWDIESKEW